MSALVSTLETLIDVTKVQKVSYCIPTFLRDEQIKLSTARVKGRIEPVYDDRTVPVAVACFGPSLNDTWEKLRDFKYIISCSGSHKFLVSRGIIPAWHAEVDPRAHKVALIGPPHKDVEYLIASACHPKVFDHLEGFNVKLWHVFDNHAEGMRILPRGEWALTGGANVGLRALAIARFLGFKDLHIFGMDGSLGPSGMHAAEHPSQPKGSRPVEYAGKTYRSTQSLVECARQTFHELDQLPGVRATFYGEGLVQAMAADWAPKGDDGRSATLGFAKPKLISDEYRELNAQLHRSNAAYGVGGASDADTVIALHKATKATSVLDYGAGKCRLAAALPFPIWNYDPAIPEIAAEPRPADLVVCTDVLEHVEPDKLDFVLDDLRRCVKQVGYFTICTVPASKKLANGKNTHLIVQGEKWWKAKLSKFFTVAKIMPRGQELVVIVSPKGKTK